MSAIRFVLRSAVPYTRENTLLSTQPMRFFEELAEHRISQASFAQARYRAQKRGLVSQDGLTTRGRLALFEQELKGRRSTVSGDLNLLVLFDIPENLRRRAYRLRKHLRLLGFIRVQRSVWLGPLALRGDIEASVGYLQIPSFVKICRIRPEDCSTWNKV